MYRLTITTEPDQYLVRLVLQDHDGRHLGAHQVRLTDHPASMWQGLLDTRRYVKRYAGNLKETDQPLTEDQLLERLGIFLGQQVLGP